MLEADVAIVSDFRFPGGTSSAIVAEAEALAEAGYRVVLLPFATGFLRWTRSFHPGFSVLSARDEVTLVPPGTPIRCRLVCFHHPKCFEQISSAPFHVEAEQSVLVVHHPPVDGEGTAQYDISKVCDVLGDLVSPKTVWAPVGGKVRAAFRGLTTQPTLTSTDWVNVLGPGHALKARPGPIGAIPVVGRHSRAEAIKWPDTRQEMLAAYPDVEDVRVRLMGFEPAAFDWLDTLPKGWEVLPFGHTRPDKFLETIDYLSYFHGRAWIEAFGRSILEAMATGAVCLLPRDFEPIFSEGARYCTAEQVVSEVRSLHGDPREYARQSERAVALVRDRFGPNVAVSRVRERIGDPRGHPAPMISRANLPRILYLASNGVGLGHQTRVMALARRHRDRAEPVVVSMSKAFRIAKEDGMLAEYLPFFRSSGMDHDRWDALLRHEMVAMFRFYKPAVVALDSNVPFGGLLEAFDAFPDIRRVWLRRAMWPPGVGESFLTKGNRFDAIIEPGEIAGALDRGLTRSFRRKLRTVAPVTYLRSGEALDRATARKVLGLKPDRPAVFLQLGAGNNIRIAGLRNTIFDKLAADIEGPTPQVVVGDWQNGKLATEYPSDVTVLRTFPFARFLNAFDFAIAMAGYNTFHENLYAGLPTLFLSNEHPEQDEQWKRADYARIHGMALAARAGNTFDLVRGIYQLSRRDVRERLRDACRRIPSENGADEAATFLADLAYSAKPHAAEQDDC